MLFLSFILVFFITVNSKTCPTRSSIEKSLLDAHIPGAAIVVVNTTDVLYEQAFGHQSFLPTRLMDINESIFVLASISKTFIAIATMQLVESNLLNVDQDINQYLLSSDPKITHPLYPTILITLRQLLSHSASIGPNQELESTFFQSDDKALTETTLAEACFDYLNHDNSNWLSRPPGTVTYYSNVGSSLAALIIERITNISYEKYIRDKILKPLKIDVRKAGFRLSDIDDQTNLVKHYTFNSSKSDYNKFTPSLNLTEVKIKLISIAIISKKNSLD